MAQQLAEWGVVAGRTTLREFRPESTSLDDLRQKIADQRYQEGILRDQERNAEISARIRTIELQTDINAEQKRRMIEVVLLQARLDTLGRDLGTVELLLTQLKQMGVPSIIGANADVILDHMPMAAAMDMINRIAPDYRLATPEVAATEGLPPPAPPSPV